MKTSLFLLIGILLPLVSGCATRVADSEAPQFVNVRVVDGPTSFSQHDAEGHPNDVICKRERMIGSRFSRLVCRQRHEIEDERRAAEQTVRRVREYNAADFMRR